MSESGLPKGWVETTLGGVARLNPPKPSSQELADDTPVSFLPMAAVEVGTGKMDVSQTRFWREVRKGYTSFRENDVLFAKITPCMENGKHAVAKGLRGGYGAGSTEFHVLRAEEGVEPRLLLYFVHQESFRREARGAMQGAAGQLRVPESFLTEAPFLLPPFPEQHRIVDEIEKQFSRLDAGVAALKRTRVNLKRYRASVLQAACEGRLVPTEAELSRSLTINQQPTTINRPYEPASALLERILAERRSRWNGRGTYKEPAPPDASDLPELPEGWCWATLDQISTFVTSGSRGWAQFYASDGAQFLRIGNLDHASITLDLRDVQCVCPPAAAEASRTRVRLGDLLVSITADLGMVALVDRDLGEAYINQHIALVRSVDGVERTYVAWFLASEAGGQRQFQSMKRGATKIGLGLDDIRSVLVPLPPLAEQHRIVAEVERRLSVIDQLESVSETNLKRAERLRQAILKRAFEGKLVPQDPNDEPAGVLLERIRADKEVNNTRVV